ncbi:MAG: FliM/FliN family flagellar motor switch protein [SAR324 cluster bacterium]|nr:FliM/FliN family flagellar motor switch protein [SAR324 cluster bacterium]
MDSPKKKKQTQEEIQSIQLEKLLDMKFKARLILGQCTMEIGDVLRLGQGAVLELDTQINESVQVWVNEKPVAKAETVVVNERFGAKITEIASKEERLKDMTDGD